jgi:hypothetical protein
MIWGTWVDPNFRFRALDREGKVEQHFCYAESEDKLKVRLLEKNLIVQSVEPYDFSEWKERAASATKKAVDEYKNGKRPINFKREIWAELKWHLFELFHGKCAYCESKPLSVEAGDVEHYRPKSKVSEDPNHPGYYWLAYDVTNLLPACEDCNRNFGKMSHFPVKGQHAHNPKGVVHEKPLLLNPYDRAIDPFEHLEFDEFGVALPRNGSPYGESSKTYYHLNRANLGGARQIALKNVGRDWIVMTGILSSFTDRHQVFRKELKMGYREYSAAQLCELDRIARMP